MPEVIRLIRQLLVIVFLSLCSLKYVNATDSPFFSTLSIRDGLPSNIVSAITQDGKGFIWIGTGNGLCRYDGHRFITFKKEGANSLPANEISSLLIDGDYVWVGTWKGLCKINILTFEITPIEMGRNNVIRTLYKDPENTIWIGTATGLIKYSTERLIEYNSANSKLSHSTIRSILTDKYGNVWVGTYDKLNKLPKGQSEFVVIDLKGDYKPSLKNNLICDIKPSSFSDSLIWVGTETGLCLVNIFSGKYKHYNEKNAQFSNEVIKYIYTDDDDNLWLGTDFGLNIFNPKTNSVKTLFHNPQLPYSICNNVSWQIMEDTGGVVWFVTSNGLSKMNKFSNYSYHDVSHTINGQTIGNQVKSMLVTKMGVMWLATQHGVIRVDPKTGKKKIFDTQSEEKERILLNNVSALEEDDYGRVWIGTAGGINIWDDPKGKMHSITSNATNGLITNYIAKFTKGVDGSFWVSAWEGGLFKIAGNFQDINSLHFELVGDFGSEKNVSGANAIWAINYNELFRIDLQSYFSKSISSFNALSNKRNISCLHFSRKGSLWAGTTNGLIEYKPQTDSAIFNPLITGNDVVLVSLSEDKEGNIWGATAGSIIKYSILDKRAEIFPLDKDIPLKSFFDGCTTLSTNGDILFGGDNGYIGIAPSAKPNLYKPNVYVTSLEINNKNISALENTDAEVFLNQDIAFTHDITLSYANRSIAVEFAALHYWQPEMSIYAYQLEGVDKQWNYVSGAKNFAVYSNLSPGSYTLKVRGANNYGVWSDAIARIQLKVKPPLFLSNGFIVLYIALLILSIIGALRFYSARVHLKNELKIVRIERAHEDEITLTKQQFFTNISHELRTPISLILPPIQQVLKRENIDEDSKSLIKLAEKNSYRLLRVVNQILDFRKLEHDRLELKITCFDIVAFCKDLHILFSDKAARNKIKFNFHSEVESCNIWADKDKIETILYNLLSNAFKFTSTEGTIDFVISQGQADQDFVKGSVKIKIIDTGIGIATEDQPKIFDRFFQTEQSRKTGEGSGIGLTMVAEYTKLHHGKVNVESNLGKGSSFHITLPLGNVHYPMDSEHETKPLNLLATKTDSDDKENQKPYLYDVDSGKPLILIVEDNTDMIDFLRMNLKEHYHILTAENGEEALQKTNSFFPEVIISDIMMPIMDGLTLCKKIKENQRTSHIGIILLTAKNLTTQKIEGIRIGADAYLTKPFEMELLAANIDHLIKRKKELSHYFKTEIITHPEIQSTKENVDDKFVKKVMNIIEANISNSEFNVEMLSEEIGMSSTHLYRKLKSLTHVSAKDIIKKYRIKKASILLKNKAGNISEIMYDVGFSNLSYFAKCFKSEFGLSPKDYQQKMSKDNHDIEFKS
jgi:signal transduction histidine kinase/ligand-binding sensor domain-containing protein/DNA-binding response OmpR family regulator